MVISIFLGSLLGSMALGMPIAFALLICGVASENSVEATARSAGNLDFTTWVAEDACYTFAKTDFAGRPRSAEEVHAMAMANLHGEYATVTSTAAMLERLRASGSPC